MNDAPLAAAPTADSDSDSGCGFSTAPVDIPLALYVHLPWCARKCPYCDFNSHAVRAPIPETEYVDALIRDLDFELQQGQARPLSSVFFGGGTPSLFGAAAIGRVLEHASRRLGFEPDIEITLEANPGTAEAGRFRGYRAAGVNRLSIGVQSFDDSHLRALGRIHGRDEALAAVRMARDAGFEHLNLDLMFALPAQTPQQALADLDTAITLQPGHLSWYHLTVEPNTEFAARPPAALPDADTAAMLHDAGCARLAAAGYTQYETSAFAQPGRRCRHNLNYWQFGDYLGIGAGAHGKRSRAAATAREVDDDIANDIANAIANNRTGEGARAGLRIERRARHKHPRTFMARAGSAGAIQERRLLQTAELPFEFCMNALRLHRGVPRSMFAQRTGLHDAVLRRPLREALRLGLVETGGDRLMPSVAGCRHQNRLLELFL